MTLKQKFQAFLAFIENEPEYVLVDPISLLFIPWQYKLSGYVSDPEKGVSVFVKAHDDKYYRQAPNSGVKLNDPEWSVLCTFGTQETNKFDYPVVVCFGDPFPGQHVISDIDFDGKIVAVTHERLTVFRF